MVGSPQGYLAATTGSTRLPASLSDFTDFPLVYTDLLSTQDTLSIVATSRTGTSTITAGINGKEFY